MRRTVILLLASLCIVAATVEALAGELDGTWVGETLVNMQGTRNDDFAKRLKWVIAADKFTLHNGDRSSDGKVTFDEKATPKTIDASATTGMGPELQLSGIYKIDGDTLTVCYFNRQGEGRPKEFEGGQNRLLFTAKRQKAEATAK